METSLVNSSRTKWNGLLSSCAVKGCRKWWQIIQIDWPPYLKVSYKKQNSFRTGCSTLTVIVWVQAHVTTSRFQGFRTRSGTPSTHQSPRPYNRSSTAKNSTWKSLQRKTGERRRDKSRQKSRNRKTLKLRKASHSRYLIACGRNRVRIKTLTRSQRWRLSKRRSTNVCKSPNRKSTPLSTLMMFSEMSLRNVNSNLLNLRIRNKARTQASLSEPCLRSGQKSLMEPRKSLISTKVSSGCLSNSSKSTLINKNSPWRSNSKTPSNSTKHESMELETRQVSRLRRSNRPLSKPN